MIPEKFINEKELMDFMSEPDDELVEFFNSLDGDLMILGIGGKIGWTIGKMAVDAIKKSGKNINVYGVSRFTRKSVKENLDEVGVKTIKCDLTVQEEVEKLPIVKNIIYMAGKKFGTSGGENSTWAMNVVIPSYVAKHFSKSKIVVFSTGCVYDFSKVGSGGSIESDLLTPIGEYSNSAVGRERVFSYFSDINKTPICIFRLNYSVELRYGVIREIIEKVYNEEIIDLSMGQVNVIWQGDVAKYALLLLNEAQSPAEAFNVTGPETVSIRYIANYAAKKMNKELKLVGEEDEIALLSNSSKLFAKYGYPKISLNTILDWTIDWIEEGGNSLNMPTHYETKDGLY